jgi:branched-subunit amino acid transport protein
MQMSSGVYIYIYIFVMAFATWLMRVAASLVMKKPIENRFFQSFLYYVPYVTLAVMTFPDIIHSTSSVWSGLLALIVGGALAFSGRSLFTVAVLSCAAVFVSEMFLL